MRGEAWIPRFLAYLTDIHPHCYCIGLCKNTNTQQSEYQEDHRNNQE
jgi:hypothetical protein